MMSPTLTAKWRSSSEPTRLIPEKKPMKKLILIIAAGLLWLGGYANAVEVLRMSTTTSTENSGLLAVLNPVFESRFKVRLDVIAVGSGKALKLGENGDVDVVFVHAPQAELKFVEAGFGIDRKSVMHNDFVLAGPVSDLANVGGVTSAAEAMRKISQNRVEFISRGDDSGTHKKERRLWRAAGLTPEGSWYVSAGQGMGAVLKIADEKQAYTLSDRGTFLAMEEKVALKIVFSGDPALFNPYHIMAVNPVKHPHVNYRLAKQYIDFVVSEQGQRIIAEFKKGGQQLFYPDAR